MVKPPDQPVIVDSQGIERFQGNSIVQFLLQAGPFDLNQLSEMDWPIEDKRQFAQLIGYSVSGYGDLSIGVECRA